MKKSVLSLVFLSLSALIFSCGNNTNNINNDNKVNEPSGPKVEKIELDYDYEEVETPKSSSKTYKENEIEVPENDIHSALQLAYIKSGFNSINTFAKGVKELSKSRPIKFLCEAIEEEYEEFYIEISETYDHKDSKIYKTKANYIELYNLKVGTTYYFRGHEKKERLKDQDWWSLSTENSLPRNLNIDGVTNVRDLGGYPSKLGGKIRQGLYYRGGRFNKTYEDKKIGDYVEFVRELTEEGYKTFVEDLGLKSEIDLRMNTNHYTSTYAYEYGAITNDSFSDIEYCPFPFDWTKSNMLIDEKEQVANVFKFLSHKENYPVYLHCNIGTDRTGMCSYLLGTLLGIPQEDLYRDYLFSNFGNIGGSRDISKLTNTYLPTIKKYNEANLHLDAKAYLLEAGVSEEEIQNIIDIFIDDEIIVEE